MAGKKALVVIDLQNDYLWEKRKKMFNYDTKKLVGNVNNAIESYQKQGYDILYVVHLLPNIVTNRMFIGFSIKGTPGADIYSKVNIVSDKLFEKHFSDTYTSKAFREHMAKENYTEVAICGLDLCGCVGATAKGARKTGVRVTMIEDCIGCRFSEEKAKAKKEELKAIGVHFI